MDRTAASQRLARRDDGATVLQTRHMQVAKRESIENAREDVVIRSRKLLSIHTNQRRAYKNDEEPRHQLPAGIFLVQCPDTSLKFARSGLSQSFSLTIRFFVFPPCTVCQSCNQSISIAYQVCCESRKGAPESKSAGNQQKAIVPHHVLSIPPTDKAHEARSQRKREAKSEMTTAVTVTIHSPRQ